MKNLLLIVAFPLFIIPKQTKAQDKGTGAVVAAASIAAFGVGIASIENMKERAELTATQWVLANHSELTNFSLKTLDFDGKKIKDMSSTSVISFKIQEFTPSDNPKLDGKKQVLFAFTSYGWINEQGIDFDKVMWYLIDSDEWMSMMVAYSKVSSNEKNDNIIKEALKNGLIVNRGVRVKGKMEIPFFKLDGDMYLAVDYSPEMKLVYNERSLGIFLKRTGNLVQMNRNNVIDIHQFLFDNE